MSDDARINFQGQSNFKDASDFLSKNKYIFTIINNQKFKRGDGSFISLKVIGYLTACGKVDITLIFFGEELEQIYLTNIPPAVDIYNCSKKQLYKFKGENSDTQISVEVNGRSIMYSDPVISAKKKKWIEKWS